MSKHPEVDREQFFSGCSKPSAGFSCYCRPDGDCGPVDIMLTMADGHAFSVRMSGVMRSPYSPYVMQIEFDDIRVWDDGQAMTPLERRHVAMIICGSCESQLYVSEADLLEP